jgi:hypothetical protein
MLQLEVHDSDCAELRQVARQAVGRVSERAHFVLLSAQGYSPPEIGRLLGYDVQTMRLADGLSAAGLRWVGGCAAQRATTQRPAPCRALVFPSSQCSRRCWPFQSAGTKRAGVTAGRVRRAKALLSARLAAQLGL